MGNHLERFQCYKRRDKHALANSLRQQQMPRPPFLAGALFNMQSSDNSSASKRAPSSIPARALQSGPPGKMKLPSELKLLIQSGLFSDRDRVIQIIRKKREIMNDSHIQRSFEELLDPTKPDVLLNLKRAFAVVDRRVLGELGLDGYVVDWNHFPGLLPPIFALYMHDSEVMQELEKMTHKPRPDTLQPEITPPDVTVVSMTTRKSIPLSSFHAIIMGGSLSELFRDFHEQANFLCIYLEEAHPKDKWNLGVTFSSMTQHVTMEDRMDAARELLDRDAKQHHALSIDPSERDRVPLVVDTMDNSFSKLYNAYPDRVYVIEGAMLTYIGDDVMKQFQRPDRILTDELREWLERRYDNYDNEP